MPHNTPYLKNGLKYIGYAMYDNTIPPLDTMKILIVQLADNFKIFESTSILSDCLL